MLESVLNTTGTGGFTIQSLLLCTITSLVLGIGVSLCYMYKNVYSKSFVVTLALLPVIVQAIIILVNGNLGAGVAVAGTFSLVRFRSVPGSSREIGSIFFAMAIGLATGMGYLAFAALFLAIVGGCNILLSISPFGETRRVMKELKVTIPESLDYEGLLDDILEKYTLKYELVSVKTVNMGSLYEIHYHIQLKGSQIEKDFIDQIRCRNGNLGITCGRVSTVRDEL